MQKICKHHGELSPEQVKKYNRKRQRKDGTWHHSTELVCGICDSHRNRLGNKVKKMQQTIEGAELLAGLPHVPDRIIEARSAQINIKTMFNNQKEK